ncbi:MAG: hypothetical protein MUP26_04975, partial [Desulfobulbaceae bacterium]|nr:hypothetical protein [Desulfobulbaceae bacterium]
MKSGRYLKVAFALFVGVLWIGLPSFVLCGEKVSGKIVQLSDKDRETLAVLGDGVVGKALPALP